jgi:hypothetical protein
MGRSSQPRLIDVVSGLRDQPAAQVDGIFAAFRTGGEDGAE